MSLISVFGLFETKEKRLKQVTVSPSFLFDIKLNSSQPNQLELWINKSFPKFEEELQALKRKLTRELQNYKAMKQNEVLRELLREDSSDPKEFNKKMPELNDYEFAEIKNNNKNIYILKVKSANMECTIGCLIRNEFCEESVIPNELKNSIPDPNCKMKFSVGS